jgi:DNA-binding phage protein
MVFREVSVIEIREVLRAWLAGKGLRKVAEQAGVDRKTVWRAIAEIVRPRLRRAVGGHSG